MFRCGPPPLYAPVEYIAMRGLFAGAIGTSGATYTAVEGINIAAATVGGA